MSLNQRRHHQICLRCEAILAAFGFLNDQQLAENANYGIQLVTVQ